jgi:hypothetical protein
MDQITVQQVDDDEVAGQNGFGWGARVRRSGWPGVTGRSGLDPRLLQHLPYGRGGCRSRPTRRGSFCIPNWGSPWRAGG